MLQPSNPATRVLDTAIERLTDMYQCVGMVDSAASYILTSPRLIVTGMGKCSHIGRKIVATMQSTGQPACFLHPGEALHGDLGMLQPGDAVLALSNSGETSEVLHVVRHATGPVIGITSKRDSPLAKQAAGIILIPDGHEGDTLGRAPMASSTAMLVAGDMLAAKLMDARSFTQEQFLSLHHGGYLGQAIREGK